MNNETVAVELAALKEKVGSMLTTVEDIKEAVQKVVMVDRTVAEHSIHIQQTTKIIETIWNKIDESRAASESLDRKISAVAEGSEKFKNQWGGAARAASYIVGLLQVVLIASLGWVFNLVIEADRTNVRQQLVIDQLERKTHQFETRESGK